ncbi:MAG: hypothetical protein U9N35_02835 [Euryarchaeota archaeon]|nr:hypothetical protein [Euryarchaeota archaeon]
MSVQITKKEFEELKEKVDEMEELLSVLLDKKMMESVARGKKDIEGGKVVSLETYEEMINAN